jgi:putative redox protein
MKGTYTNNRHSEYLHKESDYLLVTDSLLPENGYSPTDLVAAGLASCIAHTIGAKAKLMGIDLTGMTWEVETVMYDAPRRIGEVNMVFDLSSFDLSDKDKIIFDRVTKACVVGNSLHPDIKREVVFKWKERV